ncbi:hypothetical protein BDR06DRAFT_978096, partial [Suillus hirtellus]
ADEEMVAKPLAERSAGHRTSHAPGALDPAIEIVDSRFRRNNCLGHLLIFSAYIKPSTLLSHHSPRDKRIKYEAEEKTKIAGLSTAKELREVQETAEAWLKREEEEAESVGLKRKPEDLISHRSSKDDVYFRVNFDKFNTHIRNKASGDRQKNPTSTAAITMLISADDDLSTGLVSSTKKASRASLVKDNLGLMSAVDNPTPAGKVASFISLADNIVHVEFEIVSKHLRRRVPKAVARERHGDVGVRIARCADYFDSESDDPDLDRFVNFSLLSHLAVRLRDKVPRGTHVKSSIPYPRAFTGKDIVSTIQNQIQRELLINHGVSTTDRRAALQVARSLQQQLFFYEVEWGQKLLLQWCGGQGNSEAHREREELPTAVITSLTRCYASSCSEDDPCYSFACPRRQAGRIVDLDPVAEPEVHHQTEDWLSTVDGLLSIIQVYYSFLQCAETTAKVLITPDAFYFLDALFARVHESKLIVSAEHATSWRSATVNSFLSSIETARDAFRMRANLLHLAFRLVLRVRQFMLVCGHKNVQDNQTVPDMMCLALRGRLGSVYGHACAMVRKLPAA